MDIQTAPLQGILGYLNFSEGRPDPRVQKQWNDAYSVLAPSPNSLTQGGESWVRGPDWKSVLQDRLGSLHQEQAAAFRDIEQANRVVDLLFRHVIPAYRVHHADLLGHLPEDAFLQPFFVARLAEAVLAQHAPWTETERIVQGTLRQVNDFVGHRPISVLENKPRGEPYAHEQVRPVPLYLKGAGVAQGPFEPLVTRALDILGETDKTLLADAYFDLNLLDELALDPRGYDFAHPADKRPNYCFGEWDPHHIDNKGFYRRFVLRQVALEGLLARLTEETSRSRKRPENQEELLFEAGAVLAGIALMASNISGAGPTTHDSSTTLSNLMPRVAKMRDAFYAQLLQKQSGDRLKRLQREAKLMRQPFAGARHHINQFFSRQRAFQIQQRQLALLLAELGYPHAARRQVVDIPVASVRMLTEMHVRLTTGQLLVERGQLSEAATLLPEIEGLLQRGIACGALVDPWNILGFQGQYPRFTSLEDSIHDLRIEELVHVVDRLLFLYGRVLSENAARGGEGAKGRKGEGEKGRKEETGVSSVSSSPLLPFFPSPLLSSMRRLAEWWDRFGTLAVSDVPHVDGGEAVESAEHVAKALERWRERGDADLSFWKKHLDGFRSPKAFALVIEALLGKEDFHASLGLLMTWLSQAEQVNLVDGDYTFYGLALRWLMGVCAWSGAGQEREVSADAVDLVARFFDHLEANAEDYWQVPRLNPLGIADEQVAEAEPVDDDDDDLFGAAYEGVTYKDSTDDDVEGEVLDVMPQKDFDLAEEEPRLQKRLHFLATLAQMWSIATRIIRHARAEDRPRCQVFLRQWLGRARSNYRQLLGLLDALHDHEIPKPSGSFESMVEFDKRRSIKESLLNLGIVTCLNQALGVGALRGVVDKDDDTEKETQAPSWEPLVRSMERALLRKDPAKVRSLVGRFLETFGREPLLYTPLHQGGHPRPILRSSLAQTILRGLTANLPRQGLLRETFLILQAARTMEKNQSLSGPRVTEFDRLFQIGCQAMAEAVVDSALNSGQCSVASDQKTPEGLPSLATGHSPLTTEIEPARVAGTLEKLLDPLLGVWMDHSKDLRLSMIEAIDTEEDWKRLCKFVKRYGKDIFQNRFMTLANLRGILHRGIGAYLDYLDENDDETARLLRQELDQQCPRDTALRFLHVILHTLIENYDHFRDYNATTTQSDYGENLYQLLDFLRLKISYERQAWQLKPISLVHEVLARRHVAAAELWRRQAQELTSTWADELLEDLAKLEAKYGMRLATIRDRLEERFVQPLAIDGLCALVAPAMDQAREITDDRIIPLEEALRSFIANPTGVGLEVPPWLARLEDEFEKLQASRTALVSLAETLFQVPKVIVPFEELEKMSVTWSEPEE